MVFAFTIDAFSSVVYLFLFTRGVGTDIYMMRVIPKPLCLEHVCLNFTHISDNAIMMGNTEYDHILCKILMINFPICTHILVMLMKGCINVTHFA